MQTYNHKEANMEKSTKEADLPSYTDMEVSSLAYQLWQAAGRPAGRYIEFWNEAEQRIQAELQARSTKRAPRTSSPTPGATVARSPGSSAESDAKSDNGIDQPPPGPATTG
jgi:hypothetical protein